MINELQPHEFVPVSAQGTWSDCCALCDLSKSAQIHQPQRQQEPEPKQVDPYKINSRRQIIQLCEELTQLKHELVEAKLGESIASGQLWDDYQADEQKGMLTFSGWIRQRTSEVRELKRELQQAKDSCYAAFIDGAKWWEFTSTGATMWQSDQNKAHEAARERYPYVPALLVRELKLELQQAKQRIAELEAKVPKWIVTSQLAPEEERWCWTAYNGYVQETPARITDENEWQWADNDADNSSLYEISHWMYAPLPEPPKEPSK